VAWHDFEIAFALLMFAYCICVLLGLSLRAAYYSLERLIDAWVQR